ncbi:MAG: TraY domain-containing protein [Betaproteobacteria bacterium]|nr:TraY domain-containing protein [Betaproteobacteria bacterium]MBA3775567.1 TraY domain-containing protein [Betaproteobacteria bacterium]
MPLSIRLSPALGRRLDQLAARTGRTKTYYVTEAIKEHLGDLEDFYLAEQRRKRGDEDLISQDAVAKEFGLR